MKYIFLALLLIATPVAGQYEDANLAAGEHFIDFTMQDTGPPPYRFLGITNTGRVFTADVFGTPFMSNWKVIKTIPYAFQILAYDWDDGAGFALWLLMESGPKAHYPVPVFRRLITFDEDGIFTFGPPIEFMRMCGSYSPIVRITINPDQYGHNITIVKANTRTCWEYRYIFPPDFTLTAVPSYTPQAMLSLYPNPFQSVVRMEWDGGSAEVAVYDVAGRRVASVPMSDGVAVWDGQGVPSGVYFVRLTARERTITQKVVLQK